MTDVTNTFDGSLIENNERYHSSILYAFPEYKTGCFFKEKSILVLTEDEDGPLDDDADVMEIILPTEFSILAHDDDSITYGVTGEIEIKYTNPEPTKYKADYKIIDSKWTNFSLTVKTEKDKSITGFLINGESLTDDIDHDITEEADYYELENAGMNKRFSIFKPTDPGVTLSISGDQVEYNITAGLPFEFDPTIVGLSRQWGLSIQDYAARLNDGNVIVIYTKSTGYIAAKISTNPNLTTWSAETILCGSGGVVINDTNSYSSSYYVVRERSGTYFAFAFSQIVGGTTNVCVTRMDPNNWNNASGYTGFQNPTSSYDLISTVTAPAIQLVRGIMVDSLGRPHSIFMQAPTGGWPARTVVRYIRFNGDTWDASVILLDVANGGPSNEGYDLGSIVLDPDDDALVIINNQRPGHPGATTTNVLYCWCGNVENGGGSIISNWKSAIDGTTSINPLVEASWGVLETNVYNHDSHSSICDRQGTYYFARDHRTGPATPQNARFWYYSGGSWHTVDVPSTPVEIGAMADTDGCGISGARGPPFDWYHAKFTTSYYGETSILAGIQFRQLMAERYPLHDLTNRFACGLRWSPYNVYIEAVAQTPQPSEIWWEEEIEPPGEVDALEMWFV
jgi:hypothetical protein